MDHLPYPTDAALSPIRIPYISQGVEQYDGLDFKTFPARVGWSRNPVNGARVEWYECTPDITARRAQSWLYFGLLREFLADDYVLEDFICEDEETRIPLVCTKRLPALSHKWSLQNSAFARQSFCVSTTRYTPYMKILLRFLKRYAANGLARSLLNKLEPPMDPRWLQCLVEAEAQCMFLQLEDMLSSTIALSIQALIWSLRNSTTNCVPTLSQQRGMVCSTNIPLLRERMHLGGVCPYWTKLYLKRHSIAMMNYIAALPKVTKAQDHERCDLEHCVANTMDERDYRTRHVKDNCRCNVVGADVGKIATMIEKNQTPVLTLTKSPENKIRLDVCQADFDLPYTAISHVWSGGLGNPKANQLPQCQVEMIEKQLLLCQDKARKYKSSWNEEALLSKLWDRYRNRSSNRLCTWLQTLLRYGSLNERPLDPLVFWMDTLCIPVGQEYKHLRRKAISKMDFIYSGADNVLVLDPDLQEIVGSDASILQKSVHMMSSCWMTRCWTYQEARLARDWVFALTSNLHDLVLDYRRLKDVERCIKLHRVVWNDERQLQLEALSFVERLWPLTENRTDANDLIDFIRIWNELAER